MGKILPGMWSLCNAFPGSKTTFQALLWSLHQILLGKDYDVMQFWFNINYNWNNLKCQMTSCCILFLPRPGLQGRRAVVNNTSCIPQYNIVQTWDTLHETRSQYFSNKNVMHKRCINCIIRKHKSSHLHQF